MESVRVTSPHARPATPDLAPPHWGVGARPGVAGLFSATSGEDCTEVV